MHSWVTSHYLLSTSRHFARCVIALLGVAIAHAVVGQTDSSTESRVTVTATPAPTPFDDWRAKLDHIMSEVSGTEITVTKKATVIKLDQQPPVENNNLQELFTKAPGLLVTEQHTPGQFNFSYRGLGNPQESEYVTVLMDGVPLASDWIGFPTLYFLPLPQSVSEIQFIRGGSSLLYGPEPAPAVNFATRHPGPGSPWGFYTEQVGGANGLYSTYNVIQEANGPVELRVDGGYTRSDGQRGNGEYDLWQSNLYVGYRPDENQHLALDFHASRFDGGDPGRVTLAQFQEDPFQSTTPYNHNWVDRYSVVLSDEWKFAEGWLLQAKAWYTHQDIDARAAANLAAPTRANPSGLPNNTVFGYEEFNNEGGDIRLRNNWGEGTIFRGSTFTFGGTFYHGDAPFQRFTLTAANAGPDFLFAPRGTEAVTIATGLPTLDQDRTSDYQAFFMENLLRWGKFHIVGSFRLDHESVEVDSAVAPWTSPPLAPTSPLIGASSVDADHWMPLWGVGLGNDFGDRNETYFSASSGWRPTRYFDIAGTSRTIIPGQEPDPFRSLDFELGVHGTPFKGFWYDAGLFWMEFDNRTETQNLSNTEQLIVNSGSSRHRGFEGELSYDFLARYQHPVLPAPEAEPGKNVVAGGKNSIVPGVSPADFHPFRLIVFSNVQFLDAKFTDSQTLIPGTTRTLVGNDPAFAPQTLWKGGISFQKDKLFNVTLTAVYASHQFWADNNQPLIQGGVITVPAVIPGYKVFNLSGEWYFAKNMRLFAGISNLGDEKYYSRVFLNGTIEPALRRSGYAGVSVQF
ncbi:MAG TPA: TonB-dependent receptor [Chthoniobacterales bacterium]|jgi:Fe(3+) dicitrate transport protein